MLHNLILVEKYGLIITSRIILSFILNGPGRAIQEEDKSKRVIATRYSWVRPLYRGDRLIKAENAVFKGKEIWDFDNWPHNTRWPLNTKYYISVIS